MSICTSNASNDADSCWHSRVVVKTFVFVFFWLWCGVVCVAQPDALTAEYKVKAAYIYKIAAYVQWPKQALPESESALVIGLLGADRLADELQTVVADRRIGSHPVVLRKLRRGEPMTDIQILFIGRAESAAVPAILASTRNKPVLTVTELEIDFSAGSIINFVVMDDKVRFDVAPRQGELANLKISARLLTVARKIVGDSM